MSLGEDLGKIFLNRREDVILATIVGNQWRGAWVSWSRMVRRRAGERGWHMDCGLTNRLLPTWITVWKKWQKWLPL